MIQDIRIQEKAEKVYRLLQTYKDNNILIHFKFDSGSESGSFQNGEIIDLNLKKLTLVLKENKQGIKPILLETIDPDSIKPFREVKR